MDLFESFTKYLNPDESAKVNVQSKDKENFMTGYLFKKSTGLLLHQSWRMRFFVFDKKLKTLTYYYADDNIEVRKRRGECVVDNVEVRLLSPLNADGRDFAFEITCFKTTHQLTKGNVRTMTLCASREEEVLHWVAVINDSIKAHVEEMIKQKALVLKAGYMAVKLTSMSNDERRFITFSSDGDFNIFDTERDFNHNHLPAHGISFAALKENPDRTYGIQVKGEVISLDFGDTHLLCNCDTPSLAAEWVQILQNYILDKK